MGEFVDQALKVHSRINRKKDDHHHSIRQKEFRRYPSNIRCYTCDEKGHYSRDCPTNIGSFNKSNKKRHHAHTTEDDEPTIKRLKAEIDSSSDEEYVLISALTGTISHGSNDWLVHSGASKHMMGYKESFVNLSEHESPHNVKLVDDYQYSVFEIA